VRDEAEIRGHRRTYNRRHAGHDHPRHPRRESDQPGDADRRDRHDGADFRGDPASAMLEVLDPEQNKTFRDHYLDLPTTSRRLLSSATANQLETIPGPCSTGWM